MRMESKKNWYIMLSTCHLLIGWVQKRQKKSDRHQWLDNIMSLTNEDRYLFSPKCQIETVGNRALSIRGSKVVPPSI
jgi:hypothetical protein